MLLTDAPRPSWLPVFDYKINDYLELELNYGLIQTALYLGYFFILEPVAAVSATPPTLPLRVIDDHFLASFCTRRR